MMECTDYFFPVVVSFRADESRQTTHRLHLYLQNHYKTTLHGRRHQDNLKPKLTEKKTKNDKETRFIEREDEGYEGKGGERCERGDEGG